MPPRPHTPPPPEPQAERMDGTPPWLSLRRVAAASLTRWPRRARHVEA